MRSSDASDELDRRDLADRARAAPARRAERNASSIGGEATSPVSRAPLGTLVEMSRPAVARDHAAERLELLDWKRRVFDLYRSIRADSDPPRAWDAGGPVVTS